MRFVAMQALAAAVLVGAAAPALAVTISGTYYEDTIQKICNTSTCMVRFDLGAATTGQFLNLHAISCAGTVNGVIGLGQYFISDGDLNARRMQALSMDKTVSPSSEFSWREAVEYKVTGGPPRSINVLMRASGSSNWQLICSIVGQLTAQ